MEIYKENAHSDRAGGLRVLNLLEMRRLAPLGFISGGGHGGDDDESIVSRRLLYRKLPQQRFFKLSVLKLDGSFFDVYVGKNATVAELKVAIEELFAPLPGDSDDGISWSHVWGHFCLSYEGHKLVNDKASIRNFGIQDGDQLQFIRHMSVNQPALKRRLKHRNLSRKRLPSGPSYREQKQEDCLNYSDKDIESQADSSFMIEYGEEEQIPLPEFKVAHFLKGWLSYTRLWGASRRGFEGRTHSPRFTLQCLGG